MDIIYLSALAGAVHVLAPDHWLPASIVAWQRGWSISKTIFFALAIFVLHVAMGAAIYFSFSWLFAGLESFDFFLFSVVLVFSVMLLRLLRFSSVAQVFRSGPRGFWPLLSVFLLLGPCETIIPILIKSHQLGIGYKLPLLVFGAGTVIAGMFLVLVGRLLWNRPFLLPLGVTFGSKRAALVPVVACLLIGIKAIL